MIEEADARALTYLKVLEQGYTYREVGAQFGTTADAVRGVVRRYRTRYGLDSDTPTQVNDPVQTAEIEEITLPKCNDPGKGPEIWTIDIERFPSVYFSWSPKGPDFIPESMLIEPSRMVSFAAKKMNGSVLFASEFHHGRDKMLSTLWNILDRADIIVGYNSKRFDEPHISSALRDAKFNPPRPYKQIDLMNTVKQRFNYDYNTLKSIVKRWGLDEQKMDNEGFGLWRRCYYGDPEAWDIMAKYNKQDVRTTEALYKDMLPWLSGVLPNVGLWYDTDEMTCPACGSTEIEEDGTVAASTIRYVAYVCTSCGFRSRSNERVNSVVLRPIPRG